MGLTVLIVLHTARHTGDRRYLLAGVLIGLLPMAHPHTFIACGVVFGAVTVEAALRVRRPPIPGLLSLTHEFQLHDQFASNADVAFAGWVRANTAPDDVFISTPCRCRQRGRVVDARPKLTREPASRLPQRGVDRLPPD